MTAEIAILNKTAVALASDSAVTISNGGQALKIFESADKIFELSSTQPIGIMIYNGMQFLGIPFETIIKSFRRNAGSYDTVQQAAHEFLRHLYLYVDTAPDEELLRSVSTVIVPVARDIEETINEKTQQLLLQLPDDVVDLDSLNAKRNEIVAETLAEFEGKVASLGEVDYVSRKDNKSQPKKYETLVRKAVSLAVSTLKNEVLDRVVNICSSVLRSKFVSDGRTGIVFAGFGDDETFPTLLGSGPINLLEAIPAA